MAFQPEAAQVDDFTVFDHPGAYLVADYSLDCGACDVATRALLAPSAEYERVRTLAYVAILLFPFGVPCFYLVLLLRNRRALIRSQHTEMTKALAFLCKEYEPEWFWWEIVEVAKKMLLVGFFALEPFHPGTITQLVVALLVCLTFMMLQMQAAPFRNHEDDFLSMATSFSLVLVFFMSVILKVGSLQEELDAYLSEEQRRVFGVDAWWVAFLLIAGTVGALVLAALMLAHQMTALSLKARRDAARNDRERDELAAFRAREKARPHASSSCVTLPFPESSSRFPPRAKPALRADITTAACGTTQPFRPFLLRVAMSLTGARPASPVRRPPSPAACGTTTTLAGQREGALGAARAARRGAGG